MNAGLGSKSTPAANGSLRSMLLMSLSWIAMPCGVTSSKTPMPVSTNEMVLPLISPPLFGPPDWKM